MIIANYSFGLLEALALLLLFLLQFMFPDEHARWIFAWGYIGIAAAMFAFNGASRRALLDLLRNRGASAPVS
jgi:hypothetical protein